jgi:hypothetical protein
VGRSRRSAISLPQRSKISGTSRSITDCTPSGFRSGSPAPSVVFMSRAQISSSSGGIPMKLPITRETTGCATSVTRLHSSRPSRRSRTPSAIARIACSCSAIRFGVNPRWNSIFRRSCLGGSIAMNIARCSSRGMIASVSPVTPPRSEEYVWWSRLTACTSSARVTDQNPASSGYSVMRDVQCTGHSERNRLNSSCGGPSGQTSRSVTSTSSSGVESGDRGSCGAIAMGRPYRLDGAWAMPLSRCPG